MIEINETPFKVGWVFDRVKFPLPTATVIVKGTFTIRHQGAASLAPVQEELSEDIFSEEDLKGALIYGTDFAPFKPAADLVLSGHCFSQNGKPAEQVIVSFVVGSFSKTLLVTGQRYWIPGLLAPEPSRPEPFTKLRICYEKSYGGPGFKHNPIGEGNSKLELADGTRYQPLPNIESPGRILTSPEMSTEPAGFGPIAPTWTQRFSKTGTYDQKWQKTRWPHVPEDFSWAYFNCAPANQQVASYLNGDEVLAFKNLHPLYPAYESSLPGVRVRAFYSEVIGAPIRFEEITMHLDTLYADLDAEKVVLVWRGVVGLELETFRPLDQLLVVCEELHSIPKSANHYENLCVSRSAELQEPGDLDEFSERTQNDDETPNPDDQGDEAEREMVTTEWEAEVEAQNLLEEFQEIPPATREWCVTRHQNREAFDGLDLTGVDLSGESFSNASFRDAVLKDASFRKSDLRGADFTNANLESADFTDANLEQATLENADLTGARLVRANLARASVSGADLSFANLRDICFRDGSCKAAVLTKANLSRGVFVGADLTKADLSSAVLHGANFTSASLVEAILEGAWGYPINAERADCRGLKATDAILWGSNFRYINGKNSTWQQARLKGVDFSGADLSYSEFEEASLRGANLTATTLHHVRLVKVDLTDATLIGCDLLRGSLEKAELAGADFRWANLYRVEFLETKLEGANFSEANTNQTILHW